MTKARTRYITHSDVKGCFWFSLLDRAKKTQTSHSSEEKPKPPSLELSPTVSFLKHFKLQANALPACVCVCVPALSHSPAVVSPEDGSVNSKGLLRMQLSCFSRWAPLRTAAYGDKVTHPSTHPTCKRKGNAWICLTVQSPGSFAFQASLVPNSLAG